MDIFLGIKSRLNDRQTRWLYLTGAAPIPIDLAPPDRKGYRFASSLSSMASCKSKKLFHFVSSNLVDDGTFLKMRQTHLGNVLDEWSPS